MASQHPQIGAWYFDPLSSSIFEVVAIDEQFATIEIQFDDGGIDEMDLDQWDNTLFTSAAPPADAYSTYGMDEDDMWDDDSPQAIQTNTQIERLDLDSFQDFD